MQVGKISTRIYLRVIFSGRFQSENRNMEVKRYCLSYLSLNKGDVQSAKRKISREETAINNFVVSFLGRLFMATVEIRTRLYIYTASCTRGHYNLQTWIDPSPCWPL